MTQQNEGGRDGSSTDQQDQKANQLKQQVQGNADKLSSDARGVVATAKDAAVHLRDEGAALLADAKTAATETLRTAREYAVEEAHELSDRAHRAGSQGVDYARRVGYASADYARRAGANTGDFVTANALPLTLIGAGLGWLAWSMRSQSRRNTEVEFDVYRDEFADDLDDGLGIEGDYPIRARYGAEADSYGADMRYDYDDRSSARDNRLVSGARDAAGSARQRAGELKDRATHGASELAGRASETASALTSRVTQGASAISDRVTHGASALAERATHGVDVVRTRVGETASHLRDQASELSHEARERLRMANVRTRDFADENPLIVGAIAVAAGVGIGLLLPNTQPENRLLGETRDRLLGDARGLLGDARGIIDEARDTARETAGQIGRTAREAAQDIRGQVSDSRISH